MFPRAIFYIFSFFCGRSLSPPIIQFVPPIKPLSKAHRRLPRLGVLGSSALTLKLVPVAGVFVHKITGSGKLEVSFGPPKVTF